MHLSPLWIIAGRQRQALGMKTTPEEAAPTSTLGAGETRQISPINEQNGGVSSLISYPARPIQGGKLDRAPKKIGLWYAQPKYNGWRAVVHCPSGTMWNRHGGRLSIAHEFDAALRELKKLSSTGLIWADCEALERRHNVRCSTLIVLGCIPEDGSPIYEERRAFLESLLPLERMSTGEGTIPPTRSCSSPRWPTLTGRTPALPLAQINQPHRPGRCVRGRGHEAGWEPASGAVAECGGGDSRLNQAQVAGVKSGSKLRDLRRPPACDMTRFRLSRPPAPACAGS